MKKICIKSKKINMNLISKLFAEVNPDFLKKLSLILGRELDITKSKDNEDYNNEVLSNVLDNSVHLLMEAGLTSSQALDVLKLYHDYQRYSNNENHRLFKLSDAIDKKDYELYPYDQTIESDLRAYFILKTSKNDNFDSLLNEMDLHITKYLNNDDWTRMKKVIQFYENDEERKLLKIKHLMPENELLGQKIILTSEEKEKIGESNSDKELFYIEKNDKPDLLAMKEMVSILKGEDVHPLSIGFGFFFRYLQLFCNVKYDHENNNFMHWTYYTQYSTDENWKDKDYSNIQKDYDGIVFKINKENKLEKILFAKLPNPKKISSGPYRASACLHYSNAYEIERKWKVGDENYPYLYPEYTASKKENIDKLSYFDDGSKYYVIIPSHVAISDFSKSGHVNSYENISKNDKSIAAYECYLFEKDESNKEVINTRIYWKPFMNNAAVSLMYQHGSVIFGLNDQTGHPCYDTIMPVGQEETLSDGDVDNFRYEWHHSKDKTKFAYSNSITALILNEFKNKKIEPTDLLKKENYKYLYRIIHGLYDFDENMILKGIDYYYGLANPYRGCQQYIDDLSLLHELTKNTLPFTHRFAIWKYANDFKGITKEKQKTYISQLAEKAQNESSFETIKAHARVSVIEELVKRGMSYSEAEEFVDKESDFLHKK